MPAFPEFEIRPIEVGTTEDGLPQFEDQEWVTITVDNKTKLEKRVDEQTRKQFKDYYEAWKENEEAPINGYDLREWPGILKKQADYCRKVGIRSIEELLSASETELASIPRARELQQKAQAFLDTARSTGKASADLTKLRKDLKAKTDIIEDQKATIAAMNARLEALESKGAK